MENVKQVATGIYHTVVLTNDGNMYATGYNNVYQLADGSSSTKTKLQPMKSSDGSNMKKHKINLCRRIQYICNYKRKRIILSWI